MYRARGSSPELPWALRDINIDQLDRYVKPLMKKASGFLGRRLGLLWMLKQVQHDVS